MNANAPAKTALGYPNNDLPFCVHQCSSVVIFN